MSVRRLMIRAAGLAVLALALGGPTPGFVGNCDPNGGTSTTSVTPSEFCAQRNRDWCARDYSAGRIDSAHYSQCIMNIPMMCNGFNLPCSPSTPLAQACYNALLDASMLSTPNGSFSQCTPSTLCGGAMLEGI